MRSLFKVNFSEKGNNSLAEPDPTYYEGKIWPTDCIAFVLKTTGVIVFFVPPYLCPLGHIPRISRSRDL